MIFNFFVIFLVTFAHLLLQIADDPVLVKSSVLALNLDLIEMMSLKLKTWLCRSFYFLSGACNLDWSSEKPLFQRQRC